MRRIDYDKQDKNTGNTENHIAVDESIEKKFGNSRYAYEEGFAASSGIRGETAETSGRVKHPETKDAASLEHASLQGENSGLAES